MRRLALLFVCAPAFAWDSHGELTRLAFRDLPGVEAPVAAETLEAYLAARVVVYYHLAIHGISGASTAAALAEGRTPARIDRARMLERVDGLLRRERAIIGLP